MRRALSISLLAMLALASLAPRPAGGCPEESASAATAPVLAGREDLAWVYVDEHMNREGRGSESDWRDALAHVSMTGRSGLWFRLGDQRYVSRDAELLSSLDELFAPGRDLAHEVARIAEVVRALAAHQASLGREQGRLGREQGRLARRQAALVATLESRCEPAELERLHLELARLAEEQERLGDDIDGLGDRQERLAGRIDDMVELQERLAERRDEIARETREAFATYLRESIVSGRAVRVTGGA